MVEGTAVSKGYNQSWTQSVTGSTSGYWAGPAGEPWLLGLMPWATELRGASSKGVVSNAMTRTCRTKTLVRERHDPNFHRLTGACVCELGSLGR